jgi:hypothetical protein
MHRHHPHQLLHLNGSNGVNDNSGGARKHVTLSCHLDEDEDGDDEDDEDGDDEDGDEDGNEQRSG